MLIDIAQVDILFLHDYRADDVKSIRILDAQDTNVFYGVHLHKQRFGDFGADFVAAEIDDQAFAAGDDQIPAGIDQADIAGIKPAIAKRALVPRSVRVRRNRRSWRPDADFTLASRRQRCAIIIDSINPRVVDDLADRAFSGGASLLMLRHPLTGHALSLGDLVEGHELGHYFTAFLRFLKTLRSRKGEPHVRGNVVLRHPPASGEHGAKVGLRRGFALFGA